MYPEKQSRDRIQAFLELAGTVWKIWHLTSGSQPVPASRLGGVEQGLGT